MGQTLKRNTRGKEPHLFSKIERPKGELFDPPDNENRAEAAEDALTRILNAKQIFVCAPQSLVASSKD